MTFMDNFILTKNIWNAHLRSFCLDCSRHNPALLTKELSAQQSDISCDL